MDIESRRYDIKPTCPLAPSRLHPRRWHRQLSYSLPVAMFPLLTWTPPMCHSHWDRSCVPGRSGGHCWSWDQRQELDHGYDRTRENCRIWWSHGTQSGQPSDSGGICQTQNDVLPLDGFSWWKTFNIVKQRWHMSLTWVHFCDSLMMIMMMTSQLSSQSTHSTLLFRHNINHTVSVANWR